MSRYQGWVQVTGDFHGQEGPILKSNKAKSFITHSCDIYFTPLTPQAKLRDGSPHLSASRNCSPKLQHARLVCLTLHKKHHSRAASSPIFWLRIWLDIMRCDISLLSKIQLDRPHLDRSSGSPKNRPDAIIITLWSGYSRVSEKFQRVNWILD